MIHILVVDDNENTRKLMTVVLKKYGYDTYTADDGVKALQCLEEKHVDLIVLDVMMPNMDGYEFIQTIRNNGSKLPVLIVSAKDAPSDRIKGFVLGTDDYMVKPFVEQELVLRIQALLRRSQIANDQELSVGDTILHSDSFEVETNGQIVTLPKKEFQLLFQLLSFPNKTFTRRQLMEQFWNIDSDSMEHTVDVHVSRLRERFKYNNDFEIVTVRGLGYKTILKTNQQMAGEADGETTTE